MPKKNVTVSEEKLSSGEGLVMSMPGASREVYIKEKFFLKNANLLKILQIISILEKKIFILTDFLAISKKSFLFLQDNQLTSAINASQMRPE